MLMTTGSPFIVIIGAHLISLFSAPSQGVLMFASCMGGFSIVVNFIIGLMLLIRGYQEQKTFSGWGP